MMRKIFLVCILFFIGTTSILYGASNEFRVRMQIGGDTQPPSIPSPFTATPVAQTQIDLSWGASTDNVLLSGYQVFRDAMQIATTTLTTYSDSGLIASTTYSYFVRAFDSSLNISTSSNSVATTTLSAVATTTPSTTTSGGGGVNDLKLVSFSSTSQIQSVTLSWATSRYARFELQWGRTSSYEQGFVVNELYKKENTTIIDGLEPGTNYEFELIGYDIYNHKTVLKRGVFKTLNTPDTEAPTNVSNLRATADGNNVLLTWDNPLDVDFSFARIVRSYIFYPTDPQDGFIAFEGKSNSHYDEDAFLKYGVLYYTVFTYDELGNISSGATVAVSKKGIVVKDDTQDEILISSSTDPSTILLTRFSFADVEFMQDDEQVRDGVFGAQTPVTIRIPYKILPEHLKTILVTIVHPQDTLLSFSFILKVNKDKTYYEATIAPLRIIGVYPLIVSVYDYQTQKLISVEGTIEVIKEYIKTGVVEVALSKYSFLFLATVFVVMLLFILLLWFVITSDRKKRRR